jgi:hypothetical protein
MGHFGVKKTEDILADHFFWPKMRRDVVRFVARCTTCHKTDDVIAFLWLLIDSIKWLTSYHVIKQMMLLILLICSFVKLFACMVCQTQLFLIVTLNFLAIFGELFG